MKKSNKPIEQQTAQQRAEQSTETVVENQLAADAQPTAGAQTVTDNQTAGEAQTAQTAVEAQVELQSQPTEESKPMADGQIVDVQIAEGAQPDNQTAPQAQAVENEQSTDTAPQSDDAQSTADTQTVADAQPIDQVQADATAGDKKKKKKKERATVEKVKRQPKVGLYIVSLFRYFNIITLLPLALIMYAVFFASYIVDKGSLFEANLKWICVILGFAALVMLAWFITTIKKRRVCSLDAFLLMALMICASMIAQCVIFKNFSPFDGIAIATVAATAAVFVLFTVRLILFKPSEQRKNDDNKYTAKNKIGMYFKVVFAKYFFFIAMLCVIGALLILIITQSNIFEYFEWEASQTEQVVTIVFAALAALLMIVGLFIRIVRGKANVIDCMPYMFFVVGVGGLIFYFTKNTNMVLYVAIGATVVGLVWLILCQYTLLMANYKKIADDSGAETNSADSGVTTSTDGAVADSAEGSATVGNVATDNSATDATVENTASDNTTVEGQN